ncbi:hypothetical protein LP123_06255 [Moraxella bovis]|uniref:hypothetical protein n=1 Tax=Moraxella bovis TaxID=476 RepID=UPI002225D54F|nr:hypothetical protein [Moraxella bovis]UZA05120.1 hypothetical protein LP099_08050 [Moraxella bovis]UZA12648.1 hypothetical protein LP123_06255 [Moraxella bovis]UZA29000.1 hypothetical protein LP097_08515 [Moraxella bovis]
MLSDLLESNRFWAESLSARDPDYFPSLARQQSPNYFGLAVLTVVSLPMKWSGSCQGSCLSIAMWQTWSLPPT